MCAIAVVSWCIRRIHAKETSDYFFYNTSRYYLLSSAVKLKLWLYVFKRRGLPEYIYVCFMANLMLSVFYLISDVWPLTLWEQMFLSAWHQFDKDGFHSSWVPGKLPDIECCFRIATKQWLLCKTPPSASAPWPMDTQALAWWQAQDFSNIKSKVRDEILTFRWTHLDLNRLWIYKSPWQNSESSTAVLQGFCVVKSPGWHHGHFQVTMLLVDSMMVNILKADIIPIPSALLSVYSILPFPLFIVTSGFCLQHLGSLEHSLEVTIVFRFEIILKQQS